MEETIKDTAKIAIVEKIYGAINRNDIPAAAEYFDPQVEWDIPSDFPGGGIYRGLPAVEAHLIKSRENWAEGSCDVERCIAHGDQVAVFLSVHVRLKPETRWRTGQLTDVYTFRNGKVAHVRVFAERQQAPQWAQIEKEPGG